MPVTGSLLKRLRAYSAALGPRPSDAAFSPAPDGGIYSLGNVYHFFRRALQVAEIPHHGRRHGPRVYDLRHTKAMHMLQAGVALIHIRDILGHVDIRTTEVYTRADLEMKRRALEKAAASPGAVLKPNLSSRRENKDLLDWLTSL